MRNVAFTGLRLALLSAIIAGWFVSTPAKSFACSCIMSGTPTEELAKSTAVFSARVTDINVPTRFVSFSSADPVKVTFQVDDVWKGPIQETQVATTARSGASCGYEFEEGKEYIVYAQGDESDLKVSLCSRTRPLSQASADLEELGPGNTLDAGAHPGKESKPQSIGCNAPLHSGPRGIDLSMVVIMIVLAGLGIRKHFRP